MRTTQRSALRSLLQLGACAAAFALQGCGSSWTDVAQKELVWIEGAEARLALFVMIQSPGVLSATPEEFARTSSDDVVGRLGSCAAATVAGTQVTYRFADCGGAWGITGLSGTVDATYSFRGPEDPDDILEVRMVGQNVAINGQVITFDLTGGNTRRRSLWESMPDESFGVFLHPTSKEDELKWSEFEEIVGDYLNHDCKEREQSAPAILRGQGFVVDGENWELEVTAPYHRCDGRCPMAGGLVESTVPDGPSVEFDGTATATGHVGNTGETVKLPLSCTP